MTAPDTLGFLVEAPLPSEENAANFGVPEHAWSIFQGISRPRSRGRISLTGPDADDPVRIDAAALSDPEDLRAALAGIELAREIGNSRAMASFARREVMPGPLPRAELEEFARNGAGTYRHQSCTSRRPDRPRPRSLSPAGETDAVGEDHAGSAQDSRRAPRRPAHGRTEI
jgi:choline dehydrogenase